MANRSDGLLSATRLNPLRERLLQYARERKDFLLTQLYASGYPVNTEPSTDYESYQRLVSLKMAGHPDYWHNPDAQEELRKLEGKFGPSPEPRPQVMPNG